MNPWEEECQLRVLGGRTPETENERRYVAEACKLQDGPVSSFAELAKRTQEFEWGKVLEAYAGAFLSMGRTFLLGRTEAQLIELIKRQFSKTVVKRIGLLDDAHWVHPDISADKPVIDLLKNAAGKASESARDAPDALREWSDAQADAWANELYWRMNRAGYFRNRR